MRGRILLNWNDLLEGGDPLFWRWHGLEHIPEKLSTGAYTRVRRFHNLRGGPRFLTLYRGSGAPVAAPPVRPPSELERRLEPLFVPVGRACGEARGAAHAEGGALVTFGVEPSEAAILALAERPGVAGVWWLRCEEIDRPGSAASYPTVVTEEAPWLTFVEVWGGASEALLRAGAWSELLGCPEHAVYELQAAASAGHDPAADGDRGAGDE